MQKLVQNIARVSLFFFVVFGGMHISASLLLANGVVDPVDALIFNGLDLPFLFSALVYGSARLSLELELITGQVRVPLMVCSGFSLVIFCGALYFNFALPDAKLF